MAQCDKIAVSTSNVPKRFVSMKQNGLQKHKSAIRLMWIRDVKYKFNEFRNILVDNLPATSQARFLFETILKLQTST